MFHKLFFKGEKTALKRQKTQASGYPQKKAVICLQNDLYTILSTLSTENHRKTAAPEREGLERVFCG